jgi:uncharacterized membrane protein YfbV (UPF0208 family)
MVMEDMPSDSGTAGGRRDPRDPQRFPSLVVVAAAVVAFAVCLATFALGQVGIGVAAAIVALLVTGVGLDWLGMQRRRIRQAERPLTID